jgi:PmbA protein
LQNAVWRSVKNISISALAEKAVRHARKLGADSAEAYVLRQRSILVQVDHGGISNESVQEIGGVGVRVLRNKAFGFSHVDKLDEKSVEQTIENAYHIAKVGVSDANNFLPSSRPLPKVTGIYDKRIVDLQVEEVIKTTKSMLDAALNYDKRVSVDSGGVETRLEEEALMNTEGVDAEEQRTLMGVFIWGLAKENGEVTSFTDESGYSHKLDLDVERIGTTFAERAVGQFGARKVESFEGTAILDFSPVAELVGGVLAFGVRSDNVQRNASPLKRKVGSALAVAQLNVIDDGLLDGGMMTKAFDDEGCPRKRTPILEKGVLKGFLYDTYTSKKDRTESTGNSSRRRSGLFFTPFLPFETPPQLVPSNFIIEPGNQTKDQLVEEVNKGIFVGRFSGNVEYSNGNFSGIVKQGFFIEDGEMKQPLVETMISGNAYTLMKNISGIGEELKILELGGLMPSVQTPLIRAEKVKITGKT